MPACARRQQEPGDRPPGRLVTQCSEARPEITCAVFILFSWNYELFLTSLQTYEAAGYARRIIVVDNSDSHRLVHDPQASIQNFRLYLKSYSDCTWAPDTMSFLACCLSWALTLH